MDESNLIWNSSRSERMRSMNFVSSVNVSAATLLCWKKIYTHSYHLFCKQKRKRSFECLIHKSPVNKWENPTVIFFYVVCFFNLHQFGGMI